MPLNYDSLWMFVFTGLDWETFHSFLCIVAHNMAPLHWKSTCCTYFMLLYVWRCHTLPLSIIIMLIVLEFIFTPSRTRTSWLEWHQKANSKFAFNAEDRGFDFHQRRMFDLFLQIKTPENLHLAFLVILITNKQKTRIRFKHNTV